jgi:hypothetical protein
MKVRYIIDSCSRKKGDVIDIDGVIALTLIRNKVCESVVDNIPSPKVEAPIHKDVLDAPTEVVVKRKGNPNWAKK